jgi:23S rRNA pseudouridine2457 synthase
VHYIVFYKPYGVLSQFTDEGGRLLSQTESRSTLKDFIPIPDVYPVGRLDWDSEGLVLLTDDGRLQHRLSDPQYGHPRTYWVQVERIPDDSALERLATGIEIQNYRTKPARVKLLTIEPELPPREPPIRDRQNIPTAWLELTLTEGKNRQVRRMTAAVGFPTLRLVRVSIGSLSLQGLSLGEWRELTASEVKRLKKN